MEIYCDKCKRSLSFNFKDGDVYVEICEDCLKENEIEAYADGRVEGYDIGYDVGYGVGRDVN